MNKWDKVQIDAWKKFVENDQREVEILEVEYLELLERTRGKIESIHRTNDKIREQKRELWGQGWCQKGEGG